MNRPDRIERAEAAAPPSRGEALAREAGARLRAARAARRLSRKALAEMSGVSLRYIAQIEAGQGNASLLILDRLCAALDLSLAAVVADNDDAAEIAALYREADPDARAAVRAALGAPQPAGGRAARVALIGLRGAGKSTLGARLAAEVDAPFVELNAQIEALSGMAVPDLIALYGPEGYRRLEAQAVERVADAHERVVLAVAGGIVAAPSAFATLLERFTAIWLKAAPEEHMARVRAQGDERPMAGNPAAMDELRSILTARDEQYARAALVADTPATTEDEALQGLLALVRADNLL